MPDDDSLYSEIVLAAEAPPIVRPTSSRTFSKHEAIASISVTIELANLSQSTAVPASSSISFTDVRADAEGEYPNLTATFSALGIPRALAISVKGLKIERSSLCNKISNDSETSRSVSLDGLIHSQPLSIDYLM